MYFFWVTYTLSGSDAHLVLLPSILVSYLAIRKHCSTDTKEQDMRLTLTLSLAFMLIVTSWALSQTPSTESPYLMRIEHQTRQENVCMLVLKNNRYHLERTSGGRAQVYEGELPATTIAELNPLLSADKLAELTQNQIESGTAGDEIDQTMLTVPRTNGWQTLVFPNSKSRKPFKAEMDPLLKWLDRNKIQQNPIGNAAATRCVPPQNAAAAKGLAAPNASNPYVVRIVVDHYEPAGTGTTLSLNKGTASESVGGVTASHAMDVNSFKITRTCAVVYQNGRYRFEKSVRDSGILTKSEVFRENLSKAQMDELQQILDNPKLVALPSNVAPANLGREGDLISLAVARDKSVQSLGFASSGPRPASASLQDAATVALSTNIGLTNPIRKWVKQNLEDVRAAPAKDVPMTTCIPSAQPE